MPLNNSKAPNRITVSDEEIRLGYEADTHFAPKLAARLGVSDTAIYQRMKKLGIKRRSIKESHTDFAKGEDSHQWKGGRYISDAGYVMLRAVGHARSPRRGYVSEHTLIAEKVLGKPLPKGAEVHHVLGAGSEANNRNDNLVICQSRAYHALLHARMRVRDAGGNHNTQRICTKCKQVKDRSLFHSDRSNYDGLRGACMECTKTTNSARIAAKRGGVQCQG